MTSVVRSGSILSELRVLLVLVISLAGFPGAALAASVYWSDSALGVIERTDLDGGRREGVLYGLDNPEGLVVDVSDERIYWVDGSSQNIQRARLDGSDVEVVLTGVGVAAGLDLDVMSGKLYWTNVAVGTVWRANVDGTGLEQIAAREGHPRGIAVDPGGGKVYISGGLNQKLERANLDGSEIEEVMTGIASPVDVALDLESSNAYVATSTGVYRSDFSGTDFERVIEIPTSGLDLDVAAGRMYGSSFGGPVWSATLDGADYRVLVDEGLQIPRHLTLALSDVTSAPDLADSGPRLVVSVAPNPFVSDTRLEYRTSEGARVTATIHDASGRRVRTLTPAAGTSGAITWDGRDDQGRPLPRGVYGYLLRAGSAVSTGSVVRVH